MTLSVGTASMQFGHVTADSKTATSNINGQFSFDQGTTTTAMAGVSVKLFIRFREVFVSNLCLYTDYPEGFRASPQSLHANSGCTSNHDSFLSNYF
jgi:hypothetical protein